MRDIRSFIEWIGDRSIDKNTVLNYKREICKKYVPKSVNSILSSINALFTFLNWHELKVKTLKIQQQIFTDNEKELTKAEYDELIAKYPPVLKNHRGDVIGTIQFMI